MIDWIGWHYILEFCNGVLAIAAAWSVVFLAYHVVKVGGQRRVRSWRKLPQALQLAVAVLAIAWGTFGIAVIWAVRYRHGGALVLGDFDAVVVSFFRLVLIGGFLCALRVITVPMRWRWPWLGAIASAALYLVWWSWQVF